MQIQGLNQKHPKFEEAGSIPVPNIINKEMIKKIVDDANKNHSMCPFKYKESTREIIYIKKFVTKEMIENVKQALVEAREKRIRDLGGNSNVPSL